MEHKAYLKNKAGSNAVITHSDTRRNIPRGLFFAITLLHRNHSIKNELNRADCGYQVHGTERKISHLLYMDDLKLLCRNENDLKNEMKIVQTISKDINMNFGLEKCARICLKRGNVQSKMHVGSTFENDIKKMDPRKAYKYLGIEESFDIQHKNEKEKLKKEYLRRLRLVLGTEFTAKNKIQAIGSLAVPVLRYSFGIINWHKDELQKLDRKTRKLLTIHGQHQPKQMLITCMSPENREKGA